MVSVEAVKPPGMPPGVDPFLLARALSEGSHTPRVGRPMANISNYIAHQAWGGDKFPGGFGVTKIHTPDYWTLRARSAQLFTENPYASGLVKRLLTNEINTGLTVQLEPDSSLIPGLTEDQADAWSESTENRFEIWANTPRLCDYEGRRTFSELQYDARMEAIIEGDCLVVLRNDRRTNLPQVQLIRGGRVRTPLDRKLQDDPRIAHGVGYDAHDRQTAFYISDPQDPRKAKRIPAFGPRSGKRMAWLVYGTERRVDAVRGMPLLSIILQSLKELDRYKDAELRAAVVNSILAMFVEKTENVVGTRPIGGGAVRNEAYAVVDDPEREFNVAQQVPGMVIDELAFGEKPHSFDVSRPNVNYAKFEAAVLSSIAWALEIPPEILTLQFSQNYSASKAAIGEFKAYLARKRLSIGNQLCQPVFTEWLIAEVLTQRIAAPGFLDAWRDPARYVEFGAWLRSVWGGPVKPSIELHRDVKAMLEAEAAGLISKDRACQDLFGTRFSRVLSRRKKERAMEVAAGLGPEVVEPGAGAPPSSNILSKGQSSAVLELVGDAVEDILEERNLG